MKVDDFVNLVNSMDCQEFSDVPENDVELVKSRVYEKWSIDDTYSTSMNVYKCEDGYAGVVGVAHIDSGYFDRYPNQLSKLPHCFAIKVKKAQVEIFTPCFVDGSQSSVHIYLDNKNG